MKFRVLSLALPVLLLFPAAPSPAPADPVLHLASLPPAAERQAPAAAEVLYDIDRELLALGLVDVRSVDPTLAVELKYAAADNFMGEAVYGELRRAYLLPEAARKLRTAHAELRRRHPELRLLVVDGFRPRRVQRRMWALVAGTPQQPYVANPASGSMHNFGAAVDITIVDAQGRRLDMGTPVDHFGILAQPREEAKHLRQGLLTPQQVANRRLLREVMVAGGFRPLAIEWWHFDAFERQVVRAHYRLID